MFLTLWKSPYNSEFYRWFSSI